MHVKPLEPYTLRCESIDGRCANFAVVIANIRPAQIVGNKHYEICCAGTRATRSEDNENSDVESDPLFQFCSSNSIIGPRIPSAHPGESASLGILIDLKNDECHSVLPGFIQ